MGIKALILRAADIIDILINISIGAALLVFFWGLVKYIFRSDNPKEKDTGKNIMIWGVISLFVMVSVWGIIKFVQKDLGLSSNTTLPGTPRTGGGNTGGGNKGGGGGGEGGGGPIYPPELPGTPIECPPGVSMC
jgi:hypothetical protein